MTIVPENNSSGGYKYTFGGIAFRTKQDVILRCREILKNHKPSQRLGSSDLLFISDLIAIHPRASIIVGSGITAVEVYEPAFWQETRTAHKGVRIIRNDKTLAAFSFYQCISPSNNLAKFKEAARFAIYPQTIEFAQKTFGSPDALVYCPHEKRLITWAEHHVDHESPPFSDILRSFVADFSINVDIVQYVNTHVSLATPKKFL